MLSWFISFHNLQSQQCPSLGLLYNWMDGLHTEGDEFVHAFLIKLHISLLEFPDAGSLLMMLKFYIIEVIEVVCRGVPTL